MSPAKPFKEDRMPAPASGDTDANPKEDKMVPDWEADREDARKRIQELEALVAQQSAELLADEAEAQQFAKQIATDRRIIQKLEAALESIGSHPEVDDWDGDCCYGNYDDAHRHGIDIGYDRQARRARRALQGGQDATR